jgi:hypothetical protein
MEKLKIKSARGQAKVIGTLICISGSLIFTFWKGGYLFKGFVERPLINAYNTEMRHGKENWIKGSVLIFTSHIAWSSWLILQVIKSLISNDISLYIKIKWIAQLGLMVILLTAGCGLQSLPCSIVTNHHDMLFRIIAIFLCCLDFCKKSRFMET